VVTVRPPKPTHLTRVDRLPNRQSYLQASTVSQLRSLGYDEDATINTAMAEYIDTRRQCNTEVFTLAQSQTDNSLISGRCLSVKRYRRGLFLFISLRR